MTEAAPDHVSRMLDPEDCYARLCRRDPRADGEFFVAVRSTRIYCRPICPARTPLRRNVTFFAAAAAAHAAGYRPCLRCRPESAPQSPAWIGTLASINRALSLIEEGFLTRGSVDELAGSPGMTARHLRRLFELHVGTGPSRVEQTRRIHLAKKLLHETALSVTEIAFAAGFGSVRRFNESFRGMFGRPPPRCGATARRAKPRRNWCFQSPSGPTPIASMRLTKSRLTCPTWPRMPRPWCCRAAHEATRSSSGRRRFSISGERSHGCASPLPLRRGRPLRRYRCPRHLLRPERTVQCCGMATNHSRGARLDATRGQDRDTREKSLRARERGTCRSDPVRLAQADAGAGSARRPAGARLAHQRDAAPRSLLSLSGRSPPPAGGRPCRRSRHRVAQLRCRIWDRLPSRDASPVRGYARR